MIDGRLAMLFDRYNDAAGARVVAIERDSDRDARRWLTPARIAASPRLIDRLLYEYGAHLKLPRDRRTQAAYFVLDYTWYAFAPLVAAHLAAGVVPSLRGREVSVWLDPTSRAGCLALGEPSLREGGIEALRDEVVEHMAPVVDALARHGCIGSRAAWLGIGDRLVGALEFIGPPLGQGQRALADAEALVHRPGSPLDSPRHRFVACDHLGVRRTIGVRASCCRSYRTLEGGYCDTCPLVSEDERLERIRASIEEELAQVPVHA